MQIESKDNGREGPGLLVMKTRVYGTGAQVHCSAEMAQVQGSAEMRQWCREESGTGRGTSSGVGNWYGVGNGEGGRASGKD